MPEPKYTITPHPADAAGSSFVTCDDTLTASYVRAALLLSGKVKPEQLMIIDPDTAKEVRKETRVPVRGMPPAECEAILARGIPLLQNFLGFSHTRNASLVQEELRIRWSKTNNTYQIMFSIPKGKDDYEDIMFTERHPGQNRKDNPYLTFAKYDMQMAYDIPAHISSFDPKDGRRNKIAKICISTRPEHDYLSRIETMINAESKSATSGPKATDTLRSAPVSPRPLGGGGDASKFGRHGGH